MAGSTLRAIGGYRQLSATAPPAIGSELSLCERLSLQVIARAKQPLAEERVELEDSLLAFVEAAWPSLDPSRYQPSGVVDAMCEYLQAVTEGQIRRLLINVPPRSGKTLVTSVCLPAWTWARAERRT